MPYLPKVAATMSGNILVVKAGGESGGRAGYMGAGGPQLQLNIPPLVRQFSHSKGIHSNVSAKVKKPDDKKYQITIFRHLELTQWYELIRKKGRGKKDGGEEGKGRVRKESW